VFIDIKNNSSTPPPSGLRHLLGRDPESWEEIGTPPVIQHQIVHVAHDSIKLK